MAGEPTYEELKERIRELEAELAECMSETARLKIGRDRLAARCERAEEKARKLERMLNSIGGATPDIIYQLDVDGKITYISNAVSKYGYAPEDLVGGSPMDLVHPADRDRIKNEIHERRTANRRTRGREFRLAPMGVFPGRGNSFLGEAGVVKIFLLDAEGLYDSDAPSPGAFRGTRGLARDITEQRRIQEALERDKEMLRNVADNLPGIVFRFFAGPGRKSRMRSMHGPAEKIFGIKPDQIDFYERFTSRVHERDRETFTASLEDAVVRFEQWEFTGRFATPDGETRWFRGGAAPSKRGGEIVFNGLLLDITEQQRAEKERMRLENELKQAERLGTIGTLAGGIAHDFNNILTIIIGQAQLIEVLDAVDAPGLQSRMDDLTAAAHRAGDLVNQILSFSRRAEFKKKPILLSPIVKEVVKFLRASIPSTVEIRRRIKRSSKKVLADPIHIHQILMNLCTNATHSMWDSGGKLTIELDEFFMDGEPEKRIDGMETGWLQRLTVRDTGRGIAPEHREKIFDPYFTTKKKGEGVGLGLSVVHGIVKEHGGRIVVDSEPGKGATFTVHLPCIADECEERAVEFSARIPTGTERILFVDDEEIQGRIIGEILETLGYEVKICNAGAEALEVFTSRVHSFDLVITDLAMPKMTGLELAREIMAIRPDMPVVICTGRNENKVMKKAGEIGVRGFISKPIERLTLARIVRKALEPPGDGSESEPDVTWCVRRRR